MGDGSSAVRQDFNLPSIRVNNVPIHYFGSSPPGLGRRRRPRSRGLHTPEPPYGSPAFRNERSNAAGNNAAFADYSERVPPSFVLSNSFRNQV